MLDMAIKIDKYDKTTADYVKARDNYTCQRCGRAYPLGERFGLHCSHFIGRAAKSTRYDERNCDALCYGCHSYFETHKATQYRDWKEKRLGKKEFKDLVRTGNTPKSWTAKEKDEIRAEYLRKIKELV